MRLEMYKLQELTWKDKKMKQKHMQTMLFQEQGVKQQKFYKQRKPIKKKLLQKLKVKQADFYLYLTNTEKLKR